MVKRSSSAGANDKKCKFGAVCRRKNCKFVHPSTVEEILDCIQDPSNIDAAEEEAAVVAMSSSSSLSATNKISTKYNKQCWWGASCKYKHSECHYQHPQSTKKKERPPVRTSKTPIMCGLGDECHRPKCPFVHPADTAMEATVTVAEVESQCSITAVASNRVATTTASSLSSSPPPPPTEASGNAIPTAILTLKDLERDLVIGATTDAIPPSQATTAAAAIATTSLSGYQDNGDIDALLRRQKMERLQLADGGLTQSVLQQQQQLSAAANQERLRQLQLTQQQQEHFHQLQLAAQQQQQLAAAMVELERLRLQEQQWKLHHELEMQRKEDEIQQQAEIIEQQNWELAHFQQQLAMAQQQQLQAEAAEHSTDASQLPESPVEQQASKVKASTPRTANELVAELAPQEQATGSGKKENHKTMAEGNEEDEQLRLAVEVCLQELELEGEFPKHRNDHEEDRYTEQGPSSETLDMPIDEVQAQARDWDREEFKAQRNAAKKERRRLEREAKNAAEVATTAGATTADSPTPALKSNGMEFTNPIMPSNTIGSSMNESENGESDLKQKNASPKKKESKAEKKRKKLDQRLAEMEKEASERTAFWDPEIAMETSAVPKFVQLCVGEFCRKNPQYHFKEMAVNKEVVATLLPKCRDSYRKLFAAELHSRVTIKGLGKKQQDMNDRNGTILHWDESKSKYEVSVEGKKGNTFSILLPPANLEAASSQITSKKTKKAVGGHTISVANLYEGKGMLLDVDKKLILDLLASECTEGFVANFVSHQSYLEDLEQEAERRREQEEEEERGRRAERKRREEEEWQERKRHFAERKAEYKKWQEKERRDRRYGGDGMHFGFTPGGMDGGRHGMDPLEFFFRMGFAQEHKQDDGYYEFYDDDEDEWDRQWQQLHDEDVEEKNEEMAEILGVDVDDSPDDIKRVYRLKALKYHPDKYIQNNSEGLSKEESEEKFKQLQNAYDHLMSNIDE